MFPNKKVQMFPQESDFKLVSQRFLSPSDEVRNYSAHWRMKNEPNPINGSV